MDTQELGLVTLLRSALRDEALSMPADFDWAGAVETLDHHHLTGLALRGISRCGVSRAIPEVRKLTALFCGEITVSRRQMQKLESIYARLEAASIQYLPIKGAVLKAMYPQPELRIMGDADVLIREEQYPQVCKIMRELGMKLETESDHEYIWVCPELKLELHKRLVPSYNRDYYAYYGDGWTQAEPVADSCLWQMSPEDHFLYLLVHLAKHYRDGAICVKNICDFWVYLQAHPDMKETYLREELKKLKLTEFYDNILCLLQTWFMGAPATEVVELMTRTVFRGGVCDYEQAQLAASVIRQTKQAGSVTGGKWFWLRKKLFPPLDDLVRQDSRNAVLKRYPALLPFIWLRRWLEALFRPERIRRSLSDSQGILKTQTETVRKYERQLNAVGLTFEAPD